MFDVGCSMFLFPLTPSCEIVISRINLSVLKKPKLATHNLGLSEKKYYTIKDLCKVLNLKPDIFRYRLRAGYYPEPIKVNGKRRFSEQNIREIVKIEKNRN